MTLAEQLKAEREKQGLSRRQLAKMIGVSHMTIWRMENKATEISRPNQTALEVALGVKFDTDTKKLPQAA